MTEYNGSRVFCYRSGLTVFEETLFEGKLVLSGSNTAGYPLNVLQGLPSRLDPAHFYGMGAFECELNGISCNRGLEFADFLCEEDKEVEALRCTLVLRSSLLPVTFYVNTLLDGTGMLTRSLQTEYSGTEKINLSQLTVHGGALEEIDFNNIAWKKRPDGKEIWSMLYFDSDGWGREGELVEKAVENGTFTLDMSHNCDRFRHPVLFIKNKYTGEIFFVQTGWSSGCAFSVNADYGTQKQTARLSYSAEITGCAPLIIMKPGESFTSPQVHFGKIHGSFDDAVNEMHAHTRKSVLNLKEADGSPLLIGAGMGAEHDMSVETTKAYMKQLAEMGAEVFIIDAGWACPPAKQMNWGDYNGLNRPDTNRYPDNAFEKLGEYCRSLGMKFGLWVEIERLGKFASVPQEHPDWFSSDIYGNIHYDFLDFTNPDAAKWAEDELARIISEYSLDLLRVDYNSSMRDNMRFNAEGECVSLRHFDAVYKMYRNLKLRFPTVIFENCAGGGGRTDLGMMKNFNHTWVSDNQIMPASVHITNGMTAVLPPERVDRLFAGMGCHTQGELYAHMRNTMLTHISLNVIAPPGLEPNRESMEFIKHSTEIYKSFIRPFLPQAKIFHHTPTQSDIEKSKYIALEAASPDGKKSAIAVFADTGYSGERITIIPKGVDYGKIYSVTSDNSRQKFTLMGSYLLTSGIDITLSAPLSSELLLIEEVPC